jgi:hypothetical protein
VKGTGLSSSYDVPTEQLLCTGLGQTVTCPHIRELAESLLSADISVGDRSLNAQSCITGRDVRYHLSPTQRQNSLRPHITCNPMGT